MKLVLKSAKLQQGSSLCWQVERNHKCTLHYYVAVPHDRRVLHLFFVGERRRPNPRAQSHPRLCHIHRTTFEYSVLHIPGVFCVRLLDPAACHCGHTGRGGATTGRDETRLAPATVCLPGQLRWANIDCSFLNSQPRCRRSHSRRHLRASHWTLTFVTRHLLYTLGFDLVLLFIHLLCSLTTMANINGSLIEFSQFKFHGGNPSKPNIIAGLFCHHILT